MITYKFFKYLFLHIKYNNILKQVYRDENILNNLSNLFGVEFKIDWIGRIYAILNPNIIDEKLDTNTQIFEYGENGLNNSSYIERWIMLKLNAISQFIHANNLFDLLTYELKKLDNYDNYLFIIQPITLNDCKKYTKYFILLLFIIIILVIILISLKNFIY